MDAELINQAVVASIQDSAIPRVDLEKLAERYGQDLGARLGDRVVVIVQEAAAMPIEWGTKTLAEGVNDIMGRFSQGSELHISSPVNRPNNHKLPVR